MSKTDKNDPFWLKGSSFIDPVERVYADIAYEKRLEEDGPQKSIAPEFNGCGTCSKCLQAAMDEAAEARTKSKPKRSYATSSSGPR